MCIPRTASERKLNSWYKMDSPWDMTLRNQQYKEEAKNKRSNLMIYKILLYIFASGLCGSHLSVLIILFSSVPRLSNYYSGVIGHIQRWLIIRKNWYAIAKIQAVCYALAWTNVKSNQDALVTRIKVHCVTFWNTLLECTCSSEYIWIFGDCQHH